MKLLCVVRVCRLETSGLKAIIGEKDLRDIDRVFFNPEIGMNLASEWVSQISSSRSVIQVFGSDFVTILSGLGEGEGVGVWLFDILFLFQPVDTLLIFF